MNWVEGLVCLAVVIGVCFVTDVLATTVRYWMGERPHRWNRGGYPDPPERNPGPPPGAE